LQVFLMEDHELPLIEVEARIRTGSNYEPADKVRPGEPDGRSSAHRRHSRQTGDQIDDFLAAHAATIETSIGGDSGSGQPGLPQGDFDEVFKVYVEILRTPAFAQEKLDLAKVSQNSAIARRNDNVGGITGREITRLVYGTNSPLARNTEYATIAAVTARTSSPGTKSITCRIACCWASSANFNSQEMKQKIEAAVGD